MSIKINGITPMFAAFYLHQKVHKNEATRMISAD